MKERPDSLKRKKRERKPRDLEEEDDGFDEWKVWKETQPGDEDQE